MIVPPAARWGRRAPCVLGVIGSRIAARAALALVAVLVAALTLGLATASRSESVAAATAAPCMPSDRCAADAATVTSPGHTAEPCLRSASCGGGLLAGGGMVILAVLTTAIAFVASSLGRRVAAAHDDASTGRLAAGRLYRPPRFSL